MRFFYAYFLLPENGCLPAGTEAGPPAGRLSPSKVIFPLAQGVHVDHAVLHVGKVDFDFAVDLFGDTVRRDDAASPCVMGLRDSIGISYCNVARLTHHRMRRIAAKRDVLGELPN